jgi:hypothetical protein
MSAAAGAGAKRPARKGIVLALALAALVVAVFIGANAHLVYVAVTSQPDCVPHAKEVGVEGAPLRAARSAC